MSGVYIKGMEMPKEGNWKTVRIYPDGTCAVPNWQGDCTLIKGATAFSVPDHGRLIDADDLLRRNEDDYSYFKGQDNADYANEVFVRAIHNAPTIIGAEEEE